LKRPAKIKVLGKPFTITYTNESPLEEDDMGECNTEKQAIAIRDGQPLENEQDAVLHEVTHALSDYMEIRLKEGQVTKLATGLLAILKENPGFVSYLRRRK
jgi:hypothetical protein